MDDEIDSARSIRMEMVEVIKLKMSLDMPESKLFFSSCHFELFHIQSYILTKWTSSLLAKLDQLKFQIRQPRRMEDKRYNVHKLVVVSRSTRYWKRMGFSLHVSDVQIPGRHLG